MVIAIDGPAGSGKTTVARLLAKRLGISYLDTGATYRALTYAAIKNNLDLSDKFALADLARALNIKIEGDKIYLDRDDVSADIRKPQIDKNISVVVSFPEVREIMAALQRDMARGGDFVVEGRDTTTVVFPRAEYKFYLDADPEARAGRRHRELEQKKIEIDFEEVKKDLEKRDYADKSREFSPLKVSEDAVSIDTTCLTIDEVVEKLAKLVK